MWIHVLCCCCAVICEISLDVNAEIFPGKCRDAASDVMMRKVVRDDRFLLKISGNPEKYLPGELYTVIIKNFYWAHTFIAFNLTVEPKDIRNDTSVKRDVGSFKFFGDRLSKYSEECPNTIVQVSLERKNTIQVIWKAPEAGTGCIVFRLSLQINYELWYMNEERLRLELCEEVERTAKEGAPSSETEPKEKCTVNYCTCAEIPRMNYYSCEEEFGYFDVKNIFLFYRLPKLYSNSFEYLQERMFQGLGLSLLYLDHPNGTVAENIFDGMFSLQTFMVGTSSIKVVPDLRFVKDTIMTIYIERSLLTSLEGKHLQNLTAGYLSFYKNSIRFIDPDVFWGTFDVRNLNLCYNELTSIPPELFIFMRKLEYLYLSHNNLLHVDNLFAVTRPLAFEEHTFTGPLLLNHLYLQHNRIKSLGTLQQLENLYNLNIAHNDIQLIMPDQLPNSLLSLNVEGNPFKCGCNIKPFLIFLQSYSKVSTSFDTNMCSLYDFGNSPQSQSYCPSMCSCRCTEHANDSIMFVDCKSSNLYSIPHFLNNNLQPLEDNETDPNVHQFEVLIHENQNFSFHVEDDIKGINLENNNLKFLDAAQLPSNLFHLYLSNNKLRSLPDFIFDNLLNLKEVSLSGNPWVCNCNTLKFKNWLTTFMDIVLDIDDVRCGVSDKGKANLTGSVIWKLNDSDLCPSTGFELLLAMSFVVPICIILCLYAKSLHAKYKLNIDLFLYSLGFTYVKEENTDYEKIFDSFISFCHEDDEFVIRQVIAEIERRIPNIRLCLHYRHFIPGDLIHTNIINAVQNSKTTVMIISRNFLKSEWCLVEVRTAYMQRVEDKLHKLIVVKYGDLPKKMDPTIEACLKSTTYVTWGETNFWKKMTFVLPSRPTVENQDLNNAVDHNIFFNVSVSEL